MNLLKEKLGQAEQPRPAPESLSELFEEVREEFLGRAGQELLLQKNEPQTKRVLQELIARIVESKIGKNPYTPHEDVVKEMCDDILGYGPITDLVNDPEIEEIMVNRYNTIFYEKNGKIKNSPELSFRDEKHLMLVIRRICDEVGRRIDESSPRVDARLPDGSRINAVISPVAADGACLNIRKFKRNLGAEELIANGTFPEKYLGFFQACVRARLNIMVTGGSGTGKTSTLNFLSQYIPEDERVITIEDDLELSFNKPNLVRLEARGINTEGEGRVAIRDLVINSLRMRPDRVVVGEVRGGEALDMLQAMNTGHDGSMTTGHANSPEDMLTRIEGMVLMAEDISKEAIRKQIASGINLIIHLSKFTEDGSRKVTRVTEVLGTKDGEIETRDIFNFEREYKQRGVVTGELKRVSKDSKLMERLWYHGYEEF